MTKSNVTMSAVGVLLASLALTACGDRRDEAARSGDATVAQAEQNTREAARDAADATKNAADKTADATRNAADNAAQAARSAAADVKDATKGAADQASNKVADAVITTSVNAELAKDPQLSSLRIDVDTDAGRVALKGTAPDAAAKERAAQLAGTVKGVVSVDNQLTVGKG